MITFGGFTIGLLMFAVGFTMVWKSHRWREYVGSINDILGYPQYSWLDWSFTGVVLMILGLLVASGLIQAIIGATLGKFFGGQALRGT